MKTQLKLKPTDVTMAGRVGKEVRIIFSDGNSAKSFFERIIEGQQVGWVSHGYMSGTSMPLTPKWPMRRVRSKP
jgi:hypothetical protein